MSKFDIDFWKEETKDEFDKYLKTIFMRSNMTAKEVTELLESIYYTVSNEFGGC